MATTTNFGWETPDDTDLVKDGALAMRTLGNSIDTSFVDLKGGTTGQILSKASNTDLDYTWISNDVGDITEVTVSSPLTGGGSSGSVNVAIQDGTTAQKGAVQLEDSISSTSTTKAATPNSVKSSYDLANAAIPKSLIDAAGDLIVGTADNTAGRIAIGTSGYVLKSNGTTAAWAIDPTTDVVTTAGDLIYATAADTVARLGIGSAGQVLKVNSTATAPEWGAAAGGSFVGAVAYKSASAQSINNTTDTIVTYDAEEFDTDGFHSGSVNTGRMTIPAGKGGKYLLIANTIFAANATGARSTNFMKNGTSAGAFQQLNNAGASTSTIFSMSAILDLVAGDYVEVNAYQASGGALNINNNQSGTRFAIQYLGA
jgi:hypothetical protein